MPNLTDSCSGTRVVLLVKIVTSHEDGCNADMSLLKLKEGGEGGSLVHTNLWEQIH